MNAGLVALLRSAGISEPIDWARVTVLYNYAPVPPPEVAGDMQRWNRGFNLVVSAGGGPRYFVKCRPCDDPVLAWDTEIRSVLAGHRPDSISVAWAKTASEGPLTIQVSPFILGGHYGTIVTRQDSEAYIATLRRILTGMRALASLAVQGCPRLLQGSPELVVADEIADGIDSVARILELDSVQRTALADAVAAVGSVPAAPQHGDLWWQNVSGAKGEFWAIDFDSYGTIRVPMFDDFTLTLTTLALRAGGGVEGLELLMSDSEEASSCRKLLADQARAGHLPVAHLNGLLVYWLTMMAATVLRRGGIRFATPHLATVRRAAEIVAAGRPLLAVSD